MPGSLHSELVDYLLPIPIALGLPAHALLSLLLLRTLIRGDLETFLRTLLSPLLQRLGHLGLELLVFDQSVPFVFKTQAK